jgi:hypothetical protein
MRTNHYSLWARKLKKMKKRVKTVKMQMTAVCLIPNSPKAMTDSCLNGSSLKKFVTYFWKRLTYISDTCVG